MHHQKKFFETPFFFLIIGIFPVISLYGHNVTEMNASTILRPLLVCAVLAGSIFLITLAALRSPHQAAFITGVSLILLLSFGHVYSLIKSEQIAGIIVGRRRYLLLAYALCLLLSIFFALRFRKQLVNLTVIFNVFALVLLVVPTYQIIDYHIRNAASLFRQSGQRVLASPSEEARGSTQNPDVYYIILDMYTRHDYLERDYAYDNQPFLNTLTSMGFYVATCARSNYSQTQVSLTSSLNMDYIENLGNFPENSSDRTGLNERIEDSAVRGFLESRGYKTVSLSAYEPLRIESAGVYISTDPQDLSNASIVPVINPFEVMLIKGSILELLTSHPTLSQLQVIRDINYPYATHIRQQLFILDELTRIPDIPGPKFVFVHIQVPHPPFVFGANGEIVENPPPFPDDARNPTPKERNSQLYRDQVAFINQKILETLPEIVEKSDNPPVIVLQGDHGFTAENRFAILSAYYLPDGQYQGFYPNISPVNSFRLIFNQLFDTSYDVLPDQTYYSSHKLPYRYTPVEETSDLCK